MPDYFAEYEHYLRAGFITERRMKRMMRVAARRQRDMMFIMEDVHNLHNLGAIARSCDAFGVQQISFTMENADNFNPVEISNVTSSGASKWLDYRIFEDGTRNALTTLKSEGWHIAATSVNKDAQSLYEVDFTQYNKLAIMVGNEHDGISPAALETANSTIYIPMQGMTESFNVSVAAALCLFEVTRQRKASDKNWLLDESAVEALTREFIERALTATPEQLAILKRRIGDES